MLVAFGAVSCRQEAKYGEPVVHPEAVTKNVMNFLVYRQKYLRLAEDFTALDSAENVLDRGTFLKQLSTGRYFPLRLGIKNASACYQLYAIPDTAEAIRTIVAQWGERLYSLYQLEGKQLPGFSFVDVNGNVYDKINTRGKIVALKCWFIGCVPCVKEMPALNALVKEYGNRKDILFVSLAFDKKAALDSFLTKTRFDYATIPDKKAYMMDTLGITSWPTHIVVNKQGLISRILEDEKELAAVLKKEASKQFPL